MTYQELIELVQQHEAKGNLEGMQKAHDLLWSQDISSFSEVERDRIWGHIFNLREDMLSLEGREAVELSDDELAELGLKVVDPSKFDPEDLDDG